MSAEYHAGSKAMEPFMQEMAALLMMPRNTLPSVPLQVNLLYKPGFNVGLPVRVIERDVLGTIPQAFLGREK